VIFPAPKGKLPGNWSSTFLSNFLYRKKRKEMFNPLKIQEMLSKASAMQDEMKRKLAETIVEASSGGGAVTVTMNGKKELLKLRIAPAAVMGLSGSEPDVEMLEDLIMAAINEAGRKAEGHMQQSMDGMLGGLKIPGLNA